MADENQETTEPVSTTTETPAPEASGTEISVAEKPEATTPPEGSAPPPEKAPYVPNYKFKVNDQDKEFDDFVKAAIKDKETEEKFRKLYADAYGLEAVKPKYEDLKTKYPEVEKKYQQLDSIVGEILDLKEKDLSAFFERVKLPKEKVAQWMLDELKKMELPPEQKAVYDQFEETKRRNSELEKQFQQLQETQAQQAVHARTLELDSAPQRPDINSFVQAFDTASQKAGAFKEAVKECGLYEWKVNRKDLSVEEAINSVMSRYKAFVNPAAMGTQPTPEATAEKPLPVIPRVHGKAVSPTGKQARSIDDLKKIRENLG